MLAWHAGNRGDHWGSSIQCVIGPYHNGMEKNLGDCANKQFPSIHIIIIQKLYKYYDLSQLSRLRVVGQVGNMLTWYAINPDSILGWGFTQ